MEDGLEADGRDFASDEVLVCLDETSRQPTRATRTPLPTRPGQPAADDFESERNGTANLVMLTAPLAGWRPGKVTDRRTRQDFAHVLRDRADVHVPDKTIVLVMDTLDTHTLSTLDDTVPPAEARRLAPGVARDRGSRSIPRPATAPGSTSPRSRSLGWCASVSIVGSPTGRRWCGRWRPGRRGAMRTGRR